MAASAFAQTYVTGAVPILAGIGGTVALIGWCEKYPRIQIRRSKMKVFCDIGGQSTALDEMIDGEEAFVYADLIRYNEGNLSIIQDVATTNTGVAATRGTMNPGEVGTLMVQEGVAYPLYLPFPYSVKPSMRGAGGMPLGYRFLAAALDSPDDMEPLGTAPRKIRVVWHCLRALDMTVTNAYGAGKLSLYDHNMSGVNSSLWAG